MKKGRLKDRITIERYSEIGKDTLNQPIVDWTVFTRAWAETFYGNGGEQRAAAQTDATQAASFEMQSNAKTRSVSVGDRVDFANGKWDIRSIAPIGRDGIKINAVRQVS